MIDDWCWMARYTFNHILVCILSINVNKTKGQETLFFFFCVCTGLIIYHFNVFEKSGGKLCLVESIRPGWKQRGHCTVLINPQNLSQLGKIHHLHWQAGYRAASLDLCSLVPDQGCNDHPAINWTRVSNPIQLTNKAKWENQDGGNERISSTAYPFKGQVSNHSASCYYNTRVRKDCSVTCTVFAQFVC